LRDDIVLVLLGGFSGYLRRRQQKVVTNAKRKGVFLFRQSAHLVFAEKLVFPEKTQSRSLDDVARTVILANAG
jgi:hypothetical protein